MTRAIAFLAVVGALVSPSLASAAGGRVVMRCAQQSTAGFPGAFADPSNMVVGPLAWVFAHKNAGYDGAYEFGYRWKNPALVRPGHIVTMRIGAAAKDFAGLAYDHDGGWGYPQSERTVVFKGCSRAKATSRVDGRPVTFWSGGIVSTRTGVCVPIEFRVDRGAVRRRSIGLGTSC